MSEQEIQTGIFKGALKWKSLCSSKTLEGRARALTHCVNYYCGVNMFATTRPLTQRERKIELS